MNDKLESMIQCHAFLFAQIRLACFLKFPIQIRCKTVLHSLKLFRKRFKTCNIYST